MQILFGENGEGALAGHAFEEVGFDQAEFGGVGGVEADCANEAVFDVERQEDEGFEFVGFEKVEALVFAVAVDVVDDDGAAEFECFFGDGVFEFDLVFGVPIGVYAEGGLQFEDVFFVVVEAENGAVAFCEEGKGADDEAMDFVGGGFFDGEVDDFGEVVEVAALEAEFFVSVLDRFEAFLEFAADAFLLADVAINDEVAFGFGRFFDDF